MAKITNIRDSIMQGALKKLIEHSQSYIDYAQEHLKTIQEVDSKIEFLEELRHKYLSEDVYFNAEIREASGVVTNGSQISEGFDKWCDLQIEYLLKSKQKEETDISTPEVTYLYDSSYDGELSKLYQLLLDKYNLISKSTKLKDFLYVFEARPINEIVNPIDWIGKKNLNVYFIDCLFEKKKLNKYTEINHWKKAEYCFKKGSNFRQAKQNYLNSKSGLPQSHDDIDNLFTDLDLYCKGL